MTVDDSLLFDLLSDPPSDPVNATPKATKQDDSPPPDPPTKIEDTPPMAPLDKPKKTKMQIDRERVDKWKRNLNGKAVRLPIERKVVRAICRLYDFHFRPITGYEDVSDLMAGYMVFMNDRERDAWRVYGVQMKYIGSPCSASFHIWAKAFQDLPRLYLTSLRLLFPEKAVRSRTMVQWGKDNFRSMMFVNFDQFDLVKKIRLRHISDSLFARAGKAKEAAEESEEMGQKMVQSARPKQTTQATQTGRSSTTSSVYSSHLPGDSDEENDI